MDIIDALKDYWPSALYGIAILFGGAVGIDYWPGKAERKYKFLYFSFFTAVIFILIEVFVQKSFNATDATKYLVTFVIVQVAYDKIFKKLFQKWGWIDSDTPSDKP